MKHGWYFIGNIHKYNGTSAWQCSVHCVYDWSNLHYISNTQQVYIWSAWWYWQGPQASAHHHLVIGEGSSWGSKVSSFQVDET